MAIYMIILCSLLFLYYTGSRLLISVSRSRDYHLKRMIMENIKERQDKIWSDLSEETQQEYRKDYSTLCKEHSSGEFRTGEIRGIIMTMEKVFGEHNLKSTPKIKTWNDFLWEFHKGTDWNPKDDLSDLSMYGLDLKTKAKIIATARIDKLIELGYGGRVSDVEWGDTDVDKWIIRPDKYGNLCIEGVVNCWRDFIAFRSKNLAEEFMSHESNKRLAEVYYRM